MSNFTIADGNVTTDFLLTQAQNQGLFRRFINCKGTATNNAATNNNPTISRIPVSVSVPSMAAACSGLYLTQVRYFTEDTIVCFLAGLEVPLGKLTFTAGPTQTFTQLSSMPSRRYKAQSVQLASSYPLLVTTTGLAAAISAAATMSIGVTNQDGSAATITFTFDSAATPAVNTAYQLTQGMPSGTSGVRAVTSMSMSAFTNVAGEFTVYGFIPMFVQSSQLNSGPSVVEPLLYSMPDLVLNTGDVFAFYRTGTISAFDFGATLLGVADD
jgi:hypothetical protein